jgi:ATP-dependent Clp protease adapter protein ClpS
MVKKIRYGIKIYNDNENSFQYVIYTLMDLFSWDVTQAANCAHIIDRKGEYIVKWVDTEEVANQIADIMHYKRLNVEVVTE